ncbi:MAG TPA: glycosyltransferase, partial [Clostridium sp.]|nr:glycosyltransferase [Clostridium sp.]
INQPKSKFVFKNMKDEKECYEKFDDIVCVSETVKKQFIRKFEIDENKLIVKYNPIDKHEIINKSIELVDDTKKPNKFLFCTIGRLITQKGYDRLLRVHKKLMDEGYDYELWIIGEGTKREMLENFIDNNNMRDTVKLLGFKSNPYKYLSMADAFVCSSRAEGFSTVASEAVVLGKPIVTVDCSGMKELLGNNNEYGIVTDNNEEALAEGMKNMLNDKELYKKYLNTISERASMFELSKAVKSIEDLC